MKCEYHVCKKDAGIKRYCSRACNTKHRIHKTRQTRKRAAVDYLGGKCSRCGYFRDIRALQFHHRDPLVKVVAIGKMIADWKSWISIRRELDKCDLLCANCHAETALRTDGREV